MEALRQIASVSSAGMDAQNLYAPWNGSRVSMVNRGHIDYYYDGWAKKKKEKVGLKKKLKLLKGLSKDLSTFSGMGLAVDQDRDLVAQVRGKMISEAAEVLLKQLEELKAEEKELKRKRKQEKAKLKAQESSAESESSDSECEEIVHMNRLTRAPVITTEESKENGFIEDRSLQKGGTTCSSLTREAVIGETSKETGVCQNGSLQNGGTSCSSLISEAVMGQTSKENGVCQNGSLQNDGGSCSDNAVTKRIEVCMGNKCKKSGGGALLEEFQRVMGSEGAVVGCKCMGKCRDGPNVRLFNSAYETSSNPLCIGVGLEDVSAIMANLFPRDTKNLGFNPPT